MLPPRRGCRVRLPHACGAPTPWRGRRFAIATGRCGQTTPSAAHLAEASSLQATRRQTWATRYCRPPVGSVPGYVTGESLCRGSAGRCARVTSRKAPARHRLAGDWANPIPRTVRRQVCSNAGMAVPADRSGLCSPRATAIGASLVYGRAGSLYMAASRQAWRRSMSHPLAADRRRRGGRPGHVGRLAQLVEHLVYTERVGGSSPSPPTKFFRPAGRTARRQPLG